MESVGIFSIFKFEATDEPEFDSKSGVFHGQLIKEHSANFGRSARVVPQIPEKILCFNILYEINYVYFLKYRGHWKVQKGPSIRYSKGP